MGKLEGKVVLITGSGSGMGKAAAILFAREGARVVNVGRRAGLLEETVKIIKEFGGEAIAVTADVSKGEDVRMMIQKAVDTYGRLDILCNHAAILHKPAPLADVPEETWDPVIDINLRGVFLGMKYAIPQMIKQGGGVILNTTSAQGLVGVANLSPYAAAKGGIIALTRTAAIEYASYNIRVNCIALGMVKTPNMEGLIAELPPDSVEVKALKAGKAYNIIPLGRMAEAEEIAPAMLFLVSDDAGYMTGSVMVVDGGYTAQ
ncbi:MAG TPA: glucose 1-dehydrogenase [Thermodesulfobacteriota bacterium]|nr:glucose 1-dehydrogenase [Thermodesulfobacteriota bacterium]